MSVLNQGQKAAAEGFFNFLFSNDKEFIISGPAGTGKTFLMGYLIDTILPRYYDMCSIMGISPIYDKVMMTATTNKAAEVLSQATNRPTKTIHSFLNLHVKTDYHTGKTYLEKGSNWKVHTNFILFIDEASMIDYDLLQAIREGTANCKIVYVGDHCQLAPVAEKLSPIYRYNLPFFELTEQMRNTAQQPLMDVCKQLRQTVETKVFKPIQIVPGVIDHLDDAQMEDEISRVFKNRHHNSRILAYTNRRVMEYNDYIRQLRGLPDHFTQFEPLICNSPYQGKHNRIMAEEEVFVSKVGNKKIFLNFDGIELEVAEYTLIGQFGAHEVLIPLNRKHYEALCKYYRKQKNWKMYYSLKEQFPDLRPRDAATIHKAQGSTYNQVFIDLSDLSTCRNPDMAARLLYVAFSRAKERVVLYGKLAPKFGGLIS